MPWKSCKASAQELMAVKHMLVCGLYSVQRKMAVPETACFSVKNGAHELSHESVVHATIGCHVALHQPLKLFWAAPLSEAHKL